MWITTIDGFVSIVEDRDDRDLLQVRARVPADITANFPGSKVFVVPGADYRYRARVNRQEAADRLAAAIMHLDYDSHFKDVALERSPDNAERYSAYYGTWSAMARMQDFAPYSTIPRFQQASWGEDES